MLAAWQGREAEASELIEASIKDVVPRGEGMGLTVTQWASALLYNGLGRYEDALAAAQQASEHPEELGSTRALVELIEAATRSGMPERAADALQRLSETTRASGTEWALGIEARSRALLSENEAAESLYREAIDRLGRTRVPVELARAHLLYGEWLRRERRRLDARSARRELGNTLARVRAGVWSRDEQHPRAAAHAAAAARAIPTFHEYASYWLQARTDGVLGDKPIEANTRADYLWRLQGHLLPFFGARRLDEIDADLCLALKAHKIREAGDLRGAIAAGADLRDQRGRRVVPLGPSSIPQAPRHARGHPG